MEVDDGWNCLQVLKIKKKKYKYILVKLEVATIEKHFFEYGSMCEFGILCYEVFVDGI